MPSAAYQPELDAADGSPVPADVLTAFANAHGASVDDTPQSGSGNYTLPDGEQVKVVTQTAEWYIGSPGQPPLYDLSRETDTINVFAYPAADFSTRNFYLDSRNFTTDNKYYLRKVVLGSGQSNTFDYTSGQSWGAFSNVILDGIVVHPNGYVFGVNYETHRMFILHLPDDAVEDANAPVALPVSGEGLREGLLKVPVALTVTPDGRVLVLEQDNARIQAFDTKGNPVQCFAGTLAFTLDAQFKADLNSGTISTAMQQAYQQNVQPRIAKRFSLDGTFRMNWTEALSQPVSSRRLPIML